MHFLFNFYLLENKICQVLCINPKNWQLRVIYTASNTFCKYCQHITNKYFKTHGRVNVDFLNFDTNFIFNSNRCSSSLMNTPRSQSSDNLRKASPLPILKEKKEKPPASPSLTSEAEESAAPSPVPEQAAKTPAASIKSETSSPSSNNKGSKK